MLGYMDLAALTATLVEGRVSVFSRSRQAPWRKGDTSGHWLELVGIEHDCDADALLVLARPHGPTCHLERCSCFAAAPARDADALQALDAMVVARMAAPGNGYRSEEHTSELQSLMRISYAVFCLKKKTTRQIT